MCNELTGVLSKITEGKAGGVPPAPKRVGEFIEFWENYNPEEQRASIIAVNKLRADQAATLRASQGVGFVAPAAKSAASPPKQAEAGDNLIAASLESATPKEECEEGRAAYEAEQKVLKDTIRQTKDKIEAAKQFKSQSYKDQVVGHKKDLEGHQSSLEAHTAKNNARFATS